MFCRVKSTSWIPVTVKRHSVSHALFLYQCENHAIHHTTFVLALNDVENIPLSENIVVVCVSFTDVNPPISI